MASLFSLTEDMVRLLAMAEDPDVDPVAFANTLEGLQFEFEEKAESYVKVIKQLEADANAFNNMAQEFLRKKTVCEASIRRMKNALMNAMVQTGHDGKDGLHAGLFSLKVVGNGGAKPLVFDREVPQEFIKQVPQADYERIRNYLDSLGDGESCDWCHYEDRGTHLSIK